MSDFGKDESGRQLSGERQTTNLRTYVAAAARHSGATVTDRLHVQMTRDIAAGFAARGDHGGATKAQVWGWITRDGPPAYGLEEFEARWQVFEGEGLIRPYRLKKHQQRHSFHPLGTVFLMVCDRLESQGGIDELIILLDRTQALLDEEHPDRDSVAHNIIFCQWAFASFAVQVEALVLDGSVRELIDEQQQYNHQDLERRVQRLNQDVTRLFPRDFDLGHKAVAMLESQQRYTYWVEQLLLRVVDHAGRSLDFDVLSAESYLTAAKKAPLERLAEAAGELVVDAPQVWLDAGAVVDALDEFAPRHRVRYRPPMPTGTPERDPFGAVAERTNGERTRRTRAAERLLLERDRVEVTEELRRSRWPRAARMLTDLIMLDADPHAPFRVEIGDQLLVDRDAWVTYLHPVTVYRTAPPAVPETQDLPVGGRREES